MERGAFDAKVVHKGAIEAGEIFDDKAAGLDIDARVIVRHGEVIDGEVVVGRAADADRAASDRYFLHQLIFEHEA